jgi:transcriptional regulator with PAS, ATPase and Fis domain
MLEVFRLCERAIDSDITVLIEGETGTGKELIARIIHFNGPRKKMPFVSQNCGGIPDTLLSSELFGHKRGSFTGAVKDKKGLFETAHGGIFCEFYRKARSRPWDRISARKWMSG